MFLSLPDDQDRGNIIAAALSQTLRLVRTSARTADDPGEAGLDQTTTVNGDA